MTQEKLVRDRIPELIRRSGEEATIRIASNDEMDHLLRAKVVEEARELLESGEIEEIADLFEALDALLKHREIERDRIHELRKKKNEARGAFSRGYVLITDN